MNAQDLFVICVVTGTCSFVATCGGFLALGVTMEAVNRARQVKLQAALLEASSRVKADLLSAPVGSENRTDPFSALNKPKATSAN